MQDHLEEYNIDLLCIQLASWSQQAEHPEMVVVGCTHQVVPVEVAVVKGVRAAAVGLAGWVEDSAATVATAVAAAAKGR